MLRLFRNLFTGRTGVKARSGRIMSVWENQLTSTLLPHEMGCFKFEAARRSSGLDHFAFVRRDNASPSLRFP